jgi:hypothetical protein
MAAFKYGPETTSIGTSTTTMRSTDRVSGRDPPPPPKPEFVDLWPRAKTRPAHKTGISPGGTRAPLGKVRHWPNFWDAHRYDGPP